MGRYADKSTTSNYYWQLDVRDLQRKGLLEPRGWLALSWYRAGEVVASIGIRAEFDRVNLRYRRRGHGDDWEDEEYPIFLDSTPCNYGGTRSWFLCTGQRCSRRVAILYLGSIFACRHCYQLAYESQREPPYQRALTRAQNIRVRLGGNAGMSDSFPEKPKGMHWQTYRQLVADYDYQDALSLLGIAGRLGML